MSADKTKAQMLADIADDNSPTTADCEAIAAKLRRLDAVEAERGVLLHAVEEWRKLADWQSARLATIEAERDALRAEVERLTSDIERYVRAASELGETVERLTAERDALRAELAFEHMTLAHDVKPFKAHELLRRVVTCLASEYRTHKRPRHVFWAEVSSATALGSNCSAGLARWAGFDPDTGQPLDAARGAA